MRVSTGLCPRGHDLTKYGYYRNRQQRCTACNREDTTEGRYWRLIQRVMTSNDPEALAELKRNHWYTP